jgi:hypothetical protein
MSFSTGSIIARSERYEQPERSAAFITQNTPEVRAMPAKTESRTPVTAKHPNTSSDAGADPGVFCA